MHGRARCCGLRRDQRGGAHGAARQGGKEVARVRDLPFAAHRLGADIGEAGIAEPRYASLKGIMGARSKEIKQIGMGDLGIEKGEPAETIEGLAQAETRKAGTIIQDDGTAVDQIIQVLVQAKVL